MTGRADLQPLSIGAWDVVDPAIPRVLWPIATAMRLVNRVSLGLGMIAMLAASVVLTCSVIARNFFGASTNWQEEAAVFCLVGMTFLCGALVQSLRGHIGIEAITSLLGPAANRLRVALVDLMSLAFCLFFAWKSWTLLREAWIGDETSSSSWAPPLWIPYGLMAVGMTLLSVQVLLQASASFNRLIGNAGRG